MSTDHDIVARLRVYANASIDGGWASVFRADLNIAADEIERLRKERDEARRYACDNNPFGLSQWQLAKIKGWDCFDLENGNA